MAKHSHASHAWVQLKEVDGAIVLRLEDDGVGFTPEAIPHLAREGHFGLIAMRERVQMAGGRCELESRPGGGTTIRAIFQTASIAA
jgi:signal transduction histidine kinase